MKGLLSFVIANAHDPDRRAAAQLTVAASTRLGSWKIAARMASSKAHVRLFWEAL
jgi:hypothetical protein